MRERLRQIVMIGAIGCAAMVVNVFALVLLGYNDEYYAQIVAWEPVRVIENPVDGDFTLGLAMGLLLLVLPNLIIVAAYYLVCEFYVPSTAILLRWVAYSASVMGFVLAFLAPSIQYIADFYPIEDGIHLTILTLNGMLFLLQNTAIVIMMAIATYYLRRQVSRAVSGILVLLTLLSLGFTFVTNYPIEGNPVGVFAVAMQVIWMVVLISVIAIKLSAQPTLPFDEQQTITPTGYQ